MGVKNYHRPFILLILLPCKGAEEAKTTKTWLIRLQKYLRSNSLQSHIKILTLFNCKQRRLLSLVDEKDLLGILSFEAKRSSEVGVKTNNDFLNKTHVTVEYCDKRLQNMYKMVKLEQGLRLNRQINFVYTYSSASAHAMKLLAHLILDRKIHMQHVSDKMDPSLTGTTLFLGGPVTHSLECQSVNNDNLKVAFEKLFGDEPEGGALSSTLSKDCQCRDWTFQFLRLNPASTTTSTTWVTTTSTTATTSTTSTTTTTLSTSTFTSTTTETSTPNITTTSTTEYIKSVSEGYSNSNSTEKESATESSYYYYEDNDENYGKSNNESDKLEYEYLTESELDNATDYPMEKDVIINNDNDTLSEEYDKDYEYENMASTSVNKISDQTTNKQEDIYEQSSSYYEYTGDGDYYYEYDKNYSETDYQTSSESEPSTPNTTSSTLTTLSSTVVTLSTISDTSASESIETTSNEKTSSSSPSSTIDFYDDLSNFDEQNFTIVDLENDQVRGTLDCTSLPIVTPSQTWNLLAISISVIGFVCVCLTFTIYVIVLYKSECTFHR